MGDKISGDKFYNIFVETRHLGFERHGYRGAIDLLQDIVVRGSSGFRERVEIKSIEVEVNLRHLIVRPTVCLLPLDDCPFGIIVDRAKFAT